MQNYIIESMVTALKPTLKNPVRAKAILDRFWSDNIALVWDLEDVYTAANERELALTNKQATHILQELLHHHDKQLGLRWSDLTSYIEKYVLGRKLTGAELKRFVDRNILTIDSQDRRREQA